MTNWSVDAEKEFSAHLPREDFLFLGGVKSPGKCTITAAGLPRKWDKAQGFGLSGAFLRYMGDDLKEFQVLLEMWKPSQVADEYPAFARVALEKAPKGKRPSALKIVHPLLNETPLFIHEVVVSDVSQLTCDETGLWSVTISLIPFRAPVLALGKPNSAPKRADAPEPTARDKVDEELAARRARVANLMAEEARLIMNGQP